MEQMKNGKAEQHYYSNRLKQKLDKLRFTPAAVIEAPSGYGKTTAIRDFVETGLPEDTLVYWFTAVDEAPEAAYRRICRAIEKIDSNAGERLLKIKLLNAITIGEAADVIRSIRCMREAYLIIDNFHIIQDVFPLAFFSALFEQCREGLHMIFITQMLKRNMYAVIRGRGFLHIGTDDLRLCTEDISRYYAFSGLNITIEDARKVASYTEGWIIAVYLQLRAFRETGKLSDTVGILALMENLVWDGLTEEQKTFLLHLSPFDTVTLRQACDILCCSTLPENALDTLSCPFIHYDTSEKKYELHSILAELLVQKRRERGAVFEHECLLRAGDYCRDEGRMGEALGFYMQIRDYERMLSLDFSHMVPETINNIPFAELALDIVCNCPAEIKRKHILPMLQIAWALCTAGRRGQFCALMDELHESGELQENSKLLGEWTLLSSYRCFPNIKEMIGILKQAVPLFSGSFSQVILPIAPWCFGNFSPMAEFHVKPGEADGEADSMEEYIAIYSRLTNGHGSGADVLFRAELAYHRGDLKDAEILSYKAVYLAENKQQSIVQLGATLQLAQIALHRADTVGWQHAIDSMERAASFASQNTFIIRSVIDTVRGILLNELQSQKNVADWLQKGDFSNSRLTATMVANSMFVYLSYLMHQGEHARLVGTVQALQLEAVRDRPFREMLLDLTAATGHLYMGNRAQAEGLVEHAAVMALPDGLVFPFASYTMLLQGLTDELIKQNYPEHLDKLSEIKKRFLYGWTVLHNDILSEGLPSDLTIREYEVAKLAAEGLRNNEIAEKLMVTESTVRTHLRSVFQKLDIDRRTRLIEKLR